MIFFIKLVSNRENSDMKIDMTESQSNSVVFFLKRKDMKNLRQEL